MKLVPVSILLFGLSGCIGFPDGWNESCDLDAPESCASGLECFDIQPSEEVEEAVCRTACVDDDDCPDVRCPGLTGGFQSACDPEEGYCRELGCR